MSQTHPTRSKTEVLSRMAGGLARFLAVLDRLPEDQLLGPTDAAGWTVRDHLTHLAAWADGIAALLRREDRWQAMDLDMPNPESEELEYDPMNARIAGQNRHLSPAEARAWLVAAHERIAAAVGAMPEAELAFPYERFVPPFTGSGGHPIAEYILGNTEDHYEEHLPWMLAILEQSRPAEA